MKIAHINTSDVNGGAARAAYRLHRGLVQIGQTSVMVVRNQFSSDETVYRLPIAQPLKHPYQRCFSAIQTHYIQTNRTPLSNTLFSLPYPGFDLTQVDIVAASDVINLHWIARLQSPTTLKTLLDLGKPVVWTLHDMWAFTGGCHYSAGCNKFQYNCNDCPQLNHDPYNLASLMLNDKLELLDGSNLVVVAPSQWLADCARNSHLFRHRRVEVIPYGLETDVFKPEAKSAAKQRIGVHPDAIVLLAGASNANERRKGFAELMQVLERCTQHPPVQSLIQSERLILTYFGVPNEELNALNLPVHCLGKVDSDETLSHIYSAADLFLLPSLEDNFPNTMLESLSCGTPVVAFGVGGIPDLIQDGVTGKTVPVGDISSFATAVIDYICDPKQREQMAINGQQLIQHHYALEIQAKRYLELYQDLRLPHSIAASTTPLNSDERCQENDVQPLELDTALGSHFNSIFHSLSLQAVLAELERSQLQLKEAKAKLDQAQTELEQSHSEINAIKNSKFWKLKTVWNQIKNLGNISHN